MFPAVLIVYTHRSRSAQIKAGIWRRNGSGMMDQVLALLIALFLLQFDLT